MLASLIAPLFFASTVDDTATARRDTTVHHASTIVVQADVFDGPCCNVGPSTGAHTIDEMMRLGGITLVQRAQMAGEATMRGLRGGQITTTIDGMKIHAACVDKMDPATAYVELDNLRTLELTQGAGDLRYGNNLGGSLNFISRLPVPGTPSGDVEAGYDLNGATRRLRLDANASVDDLSARVGYVLRQSNDITAGGNQTIVGSGLTKHNANAILQWRFTDRSSIIVHGIYDLATDIGYPALLMDTRRAEAVIASAVWKQRWSSSVASSLRLYANTVDHTMDDLDRPVDQIQTRSFMPGMRMPMDGTSTTIGAIADVSVASTASLLTVTFDAWTLDAAAHMDMIPLDTTRARARMTNIGDARVHNIGVNATWQQPVFDELQVRASIRVDVNARSLRDVASESVLQGYIGPQNMQPVHIAPTVHAAVDWAAREELTLSFAVTRATRVPTHLETYGFFLYDPQANIVTIGDPSLRPETSWNADVRATWSDGDLRIVGGTHVQSIHDYIAAPVMAVPFDTSVDLRRMHNIGTALLAGCDVAGSYTITDECIIGASATWTYGEITATREPLPLLPPLGWMVRVVQGDRDLWFEGRLQGAMAQARTSYRTLPENVTAAWTTLDLSAGARLVGDLTAKLVMGNVFDLRYHEHTSIRDLPSRGRSLALTLRYAW